MELNEYDYSKSLNEKEENDLIEKFNLFKQIFGNSSNKDIAISLINAVLPEKEIIEDLTFENTEIYSTSLDTKRRGLRIDIYAKNKEKNFIIEMQIHEIKDILGRSELAASRIFDRLYQAGDDIIPKEKIYCVNFLYYDQFPGDKDYYHHLFTHEFNKKNISMPFKDIIVIELKKFKNNFSISEIEESVLNGQINKEIVRKLWFIFLSYINTIYYEPKNINSNQYFKIEKERNRIKVKKVNEDVQNVNVNEDVQNVNVKKKEDKTVIYVKNEINENIYKLLIKVNTIRKALDLCINLSESDMENYVKEVESDMEHLIQIRNIKKEKDEEINKIKKEKNEEINKKNEEINKKNEEINKKNEEINKIKKEKNEEINKKNEEINKIKKEKNEEINKKNEEIKEQSETIDILTNRVNELEKRLGEEINDKNNNNKKIRLDNTLV